MPLQKKKHPRQLYNQQEGKCFYCGSQLGGFEPGVKGKKATIDHVYPKSKGGSDDISNKVLACQECNQRKGDTIGWQYKPKLELKIADLNALELQSENPAPS